MVSRGKSAEKCISGILDVHVHQGGGLINLNSYGQQDVYARFLFGEPDPLSDAVLQTRTIKKGGSNPTFDQSLQIGVPHGEQILKCEVFMAQSRGRDQLIGFTRIPLHPIIAGNSHGRKPASYRLVRDYRETPAGIITLTLGYHDIQSSRTSASHHSSRRILPASITENETRTSVLTESTDHIPKQIFKRKSDSCPSEIVFDLDDNLSSNTAPVSDDEMFKFGRLSDFKNVQSIQSTQNSQNSQSFPLDFARFGSVRPDFPISEMKKLEAILFSNGLILDSLNVNKNGKENVSMDLGLMISQSSAAANGEKMHRKTEMQGKDGVHHSVTDCGANKHSSTNENVSHPHPCVDSVWTIPQARDQVQPSAQLMELFPLVASRREKKEEDSSLDADELQEKKEKEEDAMCKLDHLSLRMNGDMLSMASPSPPSSLPQTNPSVTFKTSAFKPYSSVRNEAKGNDAFTHCSMDSSVNDTYPQPSFIPFLKETIQHKNNINNNNNANNYSHTNTNTDTASDSNSAMNSHSAISILKECIPRKKTFKRLKSFEKRSSNQDQEESSSESKHSDSPVKSAFFPKSKSENCSREEEFFNRDMGYYTRSCSFPLSHAPPPASLHDGVHEREAGEWRTLFPFSQDQASDENSFQSESSHLDQSKATAESNHMQEVKEGLMSLFPEKSQSQKDTFQTEKIKDIKSKFDLLDISLSNFGSSSSSPPESALPHHYQQQASSLPPLKQLPDAHSTILAKLNELKKTNGERNGYVKAKEFQKNISWNVSGRQLDSNLSSPPASLLSRKGANAKEQGSGKGEDEEKEEVADGKSPLLSLSSLNSRFEFGSAQTDNPTNLLELLMQWEGKSVKNRGELKSKDFQLKMMEESKQATGTFMDASEEQRRMEWRKFWEKLQDQRRDQTNKGQEKIFYGSRAFF